MHQVVPYSLVTQITSEDDAEDFHRMEIHITALEKPLAIQTNAALGGKKAFLLFAKALYEQLRTHNAFQPGGARIVKARSLYLKPKQLLSVLVVVGVLAYAIPHYSLHPEELRGHSVKKIGLLTIGVILYTINAIREYRAERNAEV